MRDATPVELAYLAGLVDGEGSVGLLRDHGGPFRAPILSICNTDRALVDFAREIFGGVITTSKPRKAHHKTKYEWKLRYQAAVAALRILLPYMRETEKVRRARMLVNGFAWFTKRNGKYTPRERQMKLLFEKRFLNLVDGRNTRGIRVKQNT